jgi:hypothetical protein
VSGFREQRTDDREQTAENRGQTAEDGGQKTDRRWEVGKVRRSEDLEVRSWTGRRSIGLDCDAAKDVEDGKKRMSEGEKADDRKKV